MQREWRVVRRRGSAQELHDRAVTDPLDARTVVINEVARPALVLGSAQGRSTVDGMALARSGFDLARRRSGGGAVLLGRGDHVWVDLVVPSGDPLADDDVERATWWVGSVWSAAVIQVGRDGASPVGSEAIGGSALARDRGVSDRETGRLACFAAVGPGEVVLGGRKVVGISQRRTRRGARFQCIAYRTWDPEPLIDLIGGEGGAGRPDAGRAGVGRAGVGRAGVGRAGAVRSGPGGAEWGVVGIRERLTSALRDDAGPCLSPDWEVDRDLLPHLP